jgi:DNA-binding LacI/PurR family transcriptional regulator
MPENPDNAKFQRISDQLLDEIRQGQYEPGQRLPSARNLAKRFGVSTVTAKRAVDQLVDANYADAKPRGGVYLKSDGMQRLNTQTLNLIYTQYEGTQINRYLGAVAQGVKQRNWETHTLRVRMGENEDEAVKAILSKNPSLVMLDEPPFRGPIGEVIQQASDRVVVVDVRMDEVGVASVVRDISNMMSIIVNHLREQGHRRIGLVVDSPQLVNNREAVATWFACFADAFDRPTLERRLLTFDTPYYENPSSYAYHAVKDYLASGHCDVTAMICLHEDAIMGIMTALREAGLSIPQDMSLVTGGNSHLSQFSHPPMTAVDIHPENQVTSAMAMLDSLLENGPSPTRLLHYVRPSLVLRASVVCIKS